MTVNSPLSEHRQSHDGIGDQRLRVILHLGAHRCATTSFQHYLRDNSEFLEQNGIGFWGPPRIRNKLCPGFGNTEIATQVREAAAERIRVQSKRAAKRGIQCLIVSDENILGTMGQSLREATLYPAAGARLSVFAGFFDGGVTDIVLNIRQLEDYWASVLAFQLQKGRTMPGPVILDWLAKNKRSWREVITDVALAAPGVRLSILPYESYAGHPDLQFAHMIGRPTPVAHRAKHLNAAERPWRPTTCIPEDPENLLAASPFTLEQSAVLNVAHTADLDWLAGGANGLAVLIEGQETKPDGASPVATDIHKRKTS